MFSVVAIVFGLVLLFCVCVCVCWGGGGALARVCVCARARACVCGWGGGGGGPLVGYVIGLLFRLLGGEPGFGLSSTISQRSLWSQSLWGSFLLVRVVLLIVCCSFFFFQVSECV